MDDSHFDRIAKLWAANPSRRRLFKTLGAWTVAGVAVRISTRAGEAAPCKSPNTRCGKGKAMVCTNLQSDSRNCGACGATCEGGVCTDGECVCPAGQTDCNGRCVNRLTDASNCGACNTHCALNRTCSGGGCVCSDLGAVVGSTCCAGATAYACYVSDGGTCPTGYADPTSAVCAQVFDCASLGAGWTSCAGTLCCACCPPGTTCDPQGFCVS
jgi:hypothetical protein